MKVRFIAYGLNLWSGGGSNYSLHLTLSELHRRGVDVELLLLFEQALRAPDNVPYPIRELGWKVGNQFNTMHRVNHFLKNQSHQTDIYHMYAPQLIYGAGLYRSLGGNTPVVVTLNDYQPVCSNINLMDGTCHRSCTVLKRIVHSKRPAARKVLRIPFEIYLTRQGRQYARSVDRLLPDSESLRIVYSEAGFDMSRSTVIPEVVDYDHLRMMSGDKLSRRSSDVTEWQVAYVGRLIRAKGVDLLLDAVAQVRARIHLHIAGDGPEREALERHAGRLGLSDRVTFHGWILQDQVWNIYEQADLLVHPGRWPEPFGRTIIEAITLGVPLIVSDVGHPPTMVRDNGLTFASGDSADLARAILAATDDYDRLVLASRGARHRASEFGPEAVVDALQDLYQSFI